MDKSHKFVSEITPEELEEGVRSHVFYKIHVTKDGPERQSVCTAFFDDDDLIPMMGGLLSILAKEQRRLNKIKEIMSDSSIKPAQKSQQLKPFFQLNNFTESIRTASRSCATVDFLLTAMPNCQVNLA